MCENSNLQPWEKLIQGWSGSKTFGRAGFDSLTFPKPGLRLSLAHCQSNETEKMCEHFDLQFFLLRPIPASSACISFYFDFHRRRVRDYSTWKEKISPFLPLPSHISFFGYSFRISINIKRSDVDDDVENGPTFCRLKKYSGENIVFTIGNRLWKRQQASTRKKFIFGMDIMFYWKYICINFITK